MTVQELNISYPDFVLNTTIDPEQFDTNNREIVNKINELLTVLHSTAGASEIVADAITGVSGSVDLQTMLNALKTYLDTQDTNISTNLTNKYNEIIGLIGTANANLTTHKTSADHDSRYYTEAEIDAKITTLNTADTTNANNLTTHKTSTDHDTRYRLITDSYTKTEANNTFATKTDNASKADKITTYTKTEVDTKITNLGIGSPDITATYKAPVTTNQDSNNISVVTNKSVSIDLQGKTVINLLGSIGDCESITPFTTVGCDLTLSSADKVFGTNAIKITKSTSNGTTSFYRNILPILNTTKYYCLSGYVKNYNMQNGIAVRITTVGGTNPTDFSYNTGTTYVRQWTKLSPSNMTGATEIRANIYSSLANVGEYAFADGIMLEEITVDQYNDVNFKPSEYVNGDISVGDINTQINTKNSSGSVKTYFDVPVLRSMQNGTKDDVTENKLTKKIEKITLDGSFVYAVNSSATGYKIIGITTGLSNMQNSTPTNIMMLKYNSKNINCINSTDSFTALDQVKTYNDNRLFVSISSSDSGWGDGYTPTADEIKAYFLGWTMGDGSTASVYTTGTKYWKNISVDGTSNAAWTTSTTILPTTLATGYTQYRLYYQLATPVITEITKPNLVVYPGGTLNIESTSSIFVRPNITYTLSDSEKANIDETMKNLSDNIRRIKANTDLINTVQGNVQTVQTSINNHLNDVVTVATPNKVLKLDANSKLPASITGDAMTVGGHKITISNAEPVLANMQEGEIYLKY